jgi:hypothetical protein
MKEVDMSSEAITRRLQQVSELRDLCLSLKKASPITAERAAELRRKSQKETGRKRG